MEDSHRPARDTWEPEKQLVKKHQGTLQAQRFPQHQGPLQVQRFPQHQGPLQAQRFPQHQGGAASTTLPTTLLAADVLYHHVYLEELLVTIHNFW